MANSEDYGEHGEYSVDDETQLQPEDTLDGELGHDVLDDGFAPPDRPRAAQSFGTTAAEQQQGESLDQRLAQEEPDPALAVDDDDVTELIASDDAGPDVDDDQSGRFRSPEEAAVHLVRDGD